MTTTGSPTPPTASPVLVRRRLPSERHSVTKKFQLAYKHKNGTNDVMSLYVTAGRFEDGTLGEVFIKADRMGALAHGALDATATTISLLLQYGVPLEVVTEKLRYTRYDPSGFTGDPEFPTCTSALDLIAQWLDKRFGRPKEVAPAHATDAQKDRP